MAHLAAHPKTVLFLETSSPSETVSAIRTGISIVIAALALVIAFLQLRRLCDRMRAQSSPYDMEMQHTLRQPILHHEVFELEACSAVVEVSAQFVQVRRCEYIAAQYHRCSQTFVGAELDARLQSQRQVAKSYGGGGGMSFDIDGISSEACRGEYVIRECCWSRSYDVHLSIPMWFMVKQSYVCSMDGLIAPCIVGTSCERACRTLPLARRGLRVAMTTLDASAHFNH
jgi:hypothetical protein